ncbi:hypothetical protein PYW08_015168 [Mythimna loreyi]|uniref:Uncharacterized protein n=1 Tax=Mythimna loreyi TaxID=667449 RepID=A0ACC2QV17_9NEOP|nr:hypothetical protein PYW08_015168 [Mythimna loreyi]
MIANYSRQLSPLSSDPVNYRAFKCREVWTSLELERAFNLGIDAGLLLIPIFIMSFAYSLIVTKLWRGMRHEIQHNFKWQRHLTSCKSNHLIPSTPIIKSNSAELCCKKWYTKKLQKDDSEQRLDVDNTSTQSYCMHTVDLEFRHVVRSTHIDKSIEAKRKPQGTKKTSCNVTTKTDRLLGMPTFVILVMNY